MVLVLFIITAVVAVGAALAMVFSRSPIYSALYLVVNFFAIAAMYLMLNAEFLAIVQVIVYAGAIMVLFLFVIMLLGTGGEENLLDKFRRMRPYAIAAALLFFVEIALVMRSNNVTGIRMGLTPEQARGFGSVQMVGNALFTDYLFPFEVTSVLLLIAIVGAIYLGKRKV